MYARKLPYLKIGHRSVLFQVEKIVEALERFEVKAVNCDERRIANRASNRRNA